MTSPAIGAYTVGNEASYDRGLAEDPGMKKLGRQMLHGSLYEGGWVWRSRAGAEAFLSGEDLCHDPRAGYQRHGRGMISFAEGRPVQCAVYGLILPNGWDGDVSRFPYHDGVHRLLTDSVMVRLPRR